ncbi:transporter [Parathalassolituus penaei]|uniref:Transporter n=1 Tax=Parathalassolituus penaei TaxID=2997323 RepID=A0A9X3EEX9_9GAMM|nr:transporter [Parathalassolituus penaei]MCY0966297.1 transporter [Parathalassolituus penaei]
MNNRSHNSTHPVTARSNRFHAAALSTAMTAALLASPLSQALEISPGDYEPLPDQLNLAILYLNTTSGKELYSDGKKVNDNFKLDTQVAIVRLLHNIDLANGVKMEPQVVIPSGSLKTSGDADVLGDASGLGDIIFGLPFKWTLEGDSKNVFALAPFVYAPTGNYDKDQALNMGENRWRFLLQSTYIHHFNSQWALDSAVDVSKTTTNSDFNGGQSDLKQATRYELQSYLRYDLGGGNLLGAGFGHIGGAEREVDGVNQDDALSTTYFRATLSYFVAPQWQLQGLVGKDVKVEEGIKQDFQGQLRITRVF